MKFFLFLIENILFFMDKISAVAAYLKKEIVFNENKTSIIIIMDLAYL